MLFNLFTFNAYTNESPLGSTKKTFLYACMQVQILIILRITDLDKIVLKNEIRYVDVYYCIKDEV